MEPLPTGTVTFLFTDIQGSTAFWEHQPEAAHTAFVRHDALVEEVVTHYGGALVRPRGEGGSRFAVFTRATDAVAAAAALQRAFHAEPWPTPTPLLVRIAIHTGEADLRAGDYYGSSVNRCARLRAVAHGGQTLISHATFDLVRDAVNQGELLGVHFRDLGEHRLKDLTRSEHVHQVVIAGVPDAFPPLLSLDTHDHNLPVQRSSLLGREREIGEVTTLLLRPDVGLVTLTGPGGTGKTRLALQVAAELVSAFPDGVWFVDLAPRSDPELVVGTIAQTLSVKETEGQALIDTVGAYLRDRKLLLVLDNFEQVLDAALLVTHLLQRASGQKVLVTSRFVLHLTSEYEYRVPPLAVPDLKLLPPLERLTQYAAVQLFIQRARAVKHDFRVTNTSAPAVAEICVRLDGPPLAIELAAARVKLFSPKALLLRLNSRLKTLTGSWRDVATRQQTLRAAIDWSYDLLGPAEQTLFARLSVFVGGCTLEAAEAVCDGAPHMTIDPVAGLQSLLDKSLLTAVEGPGDEMRFTMLETIREYALERLQASDQVEQVQQAHTRYFETLAAGMDTARWESILQRVARDQETVRAVFNWYRNQPRDAVAKLALEFAAQLGNCWLARGLYQEARTCLVWAITLPNGFAAAETRSKALKWAGIMALCQNDLAAAHQLIDEGVAIMRELNNVAGVAGTLYWLAKVVWRKDGWRAAKPLVEETLELHRQAGGPFDIAAALWDLAEIELLQGDLVTARQRGEEALRLGREHGWVLAIGCALEVLSRVAFSAGQLPAARSYAEESVQTFRTAEQQPDLARTLENLGTVLTRQGDYDAAHSCLQESLTISNEIGDAAGVAAGLQALGYLAYTQHDATTATTLYRESIKAAEAMAAVDSAVAGLEGLAQLLSTEQNEVRATQLLAAAAAHWDSVRMTRWPLKQVEY